MGVLEGLIAAGVRLTVPILYAALGEVAAERSGVLNIGLEGYMAAGAFSAIFFANLTEADLLGVVGAMVAGIAVSSLMAVVAVRLNRDQILTGFALFLLAIGIVDFLHAQQSQASFTLEARDLPPSIPLPLLSDIPIVGNGLFNHNLYAYGSVVAAVALGFLLYRTRWGLESFAAGNAPGVAASKGVDVKGVRMVGVIIAGALGGLAGASLSLGALGTFSPGVTAGRGFVAIAVVIVGRWRVGWVVLGASVFGITDALRIRLEGTVDVPVQILAMLPWLVVLGMLVVGARRSSIPRALGRGYEDMAGPTSTSGDGWLSRAFGGGTRRLETTE